MNNHHEHHNEIDVDVILDPQRVEAGKPVSINISLKQDNNAVSLDTVHEKKMHLLAVNDELTWFDHLHPKENKGQYVVEETFPTAGKFLLFVDFKPEDGEPMVHKHEIHVVGDELSEKIEFQPEIVAREEDYIITLVNGRELNTGMQTLAFTVEKEGEMLGEKDLDNYLGASAHIVMIETKSKDFLHIHPVSNKKYPIYAEAHIEKVGNYRIWVQFKISGKVHTVDFSVEV